MRMVLPMILALGACAPATPEPAPAPAGWVAFRASGPFTIQVAPDLRRDDKMRGIDSLVDLLRGPGLELSFDYGMYSCGLQTPAPGEPAHVVTRAVIDGVPVTFSRYAVREPEAGRGDERLAATFANMNDRADQPPRCLTVYAACQTDADCERAAAMIRTIDFDPPG
jgi:hypothetical protein